MRKLPSIRACRGIAAVELAIVAPILVLMLFATVQLGRYMYHYSAVHNAAANAARYLSLLPELELRSSSRAEDAEKVAKLIVAQHLAELGATAFVEVNCDGDACVGDGKPQHVRVLVRMHLQNTYVPAVFGDIWLRADVTMAYVGV